jgi:hypothetical protein
MSTIFIKRTHHNNTMADETTKPGIFKKLFSWILIGAAATSSVTAPADAQIKTKTQFVAPADPKVLADSLKGRIVDWQKNVDSFIKDKNYDEAFSLINKVKYDSRWFYAAADNDNNKFGAIGMLETTIEEQMKVIDSMIVQAQALKKEGKFRDAEKLWYEIITRAKYAYNDGVKLGTSEAKKFAQNAQHVIAIGEVGAKENNAAAFEQDQKKEISKADGLNK